MYDIKIALQKNAKTLFGKLCCILREKHLQGDCVRGRILLENKGVSH